MHLGWLLTAKTIHCPYRTQKPFRGDIHTHPTTMCSGFGYTSAGPKQCSFYMLCTPQSPIALLTIALYRVLFECSSTAGFETYVFLCRSHPCAVSTAWLGTHTPTSAASGGMRVWVSFVRLSFDLYPSANSMSSCRDHTQLAKCSLCQRHGHINSHTS